MSDENNSGSLISTAGSLNLPSSIASAPYHAAGSCNPIPAASVNRRTSSEVTDRLEELDENKEYEVLHTFTCSGNDVSRINKLCHHSHIFVREIDGADNVQTGPVVANFGLYGVPSPLSPMLAMFLPCEDSFNNYQISPNYHPNPKVATGAQVVNAFNTARSASSTFYQFYFNTCQTFARRFMKELNVTRSKRWGFGA